MKDAKNLKTLCLCYDQNVAGKIAREKSGEFKKTIDSIQRSSGLLDGVDQYFLIPRHSFTLEQLGISIPYFEVAVDEVDDVAEWWQKMREKIKKHLRSLSILKVDHLKRSYENQMQGLNEEGKGIFRHQILPVLEDETSYDSMIDALTIHLILNQRIPKIFKQSVVVQAFSASVYAHNAGKMFPVFKVCRSLQDGLATTGAWRDQTDDQRKSIKKAVALKPCGDLVDSELVHLAIFGHWYDAKLIPVTSFTCDPVDIVKQRLLLYCSTVLHFVNLFKEWAKTKPELESQYLKHRISPGVVYVINENGDLIERLDISEMVENILKTQQE